MTLARQSDPYIPTNKATVAATVASIVSPTMLILSYHYGDMVMPPEIIDAYGAVIMGAISIGSALIATIMPYVGAAWWVRDRVNIPEELK